MFFNVLASLKFVLVLLLLITIACVVGTLLPQGGDVAKYLAKNPAAQGRMALLGFLGLTHVFSSWWFLGLLGLFAASLAVCTQRRCTAAVRVKGRARRRAVGSVLTHVSLLLILAGGVIRGMWGERGYLEFREGETRRDFIVADTRVPLPFAVHLADFETEHYARPEGQEEIVIRSEELQVVWPEKDVRSSFPVQLNTTQWVIPEGATAGEGDALAVRVLRRVPDFVIDTGTREVTSRSDIPRNPAVLVEAIQAASTNKQWLFAKYPDFDMHTSDGHGGGPLPFKLRYHVDARVPPPPKVKDYRSTLKILEGETVVREKTIEVNAPLSYRGYTFYQSGFNPRDPQWTSLQVVRDPGVPLVYAGFALMVIGLTMVFYVYPTGGRRTGSPGAGGTA